LFWTYVRLSQSLQLIGVIVVIEPVFFTDTMLWEVNGVSAKSLKELKSRFPKRTKIKGYNPKGNTVIKRESERYHVPTRTPLHGMRAQPPAAAVTPQQPIPRYVEYKITEHAWHAEAVKLSEKDKLRGTAIATRLGVSRSAVVGFLWRHNNKLKKLRMIHLQETASLQGGTELAAE